MPSLNISDLAWAPDVRSHWRLQGIDLQVREGEFVGLIGPNGSGKTSLLRCAYRAERPVTGWVALDGEDLWQRSRAGAHNASPWCCRNSPGLRPRRGRGGRHGPFAAQGPVRWR